MTDQAEFLMEQDTAKQVPCPDCDVDAGETCVNTRTLRPLQFFPAHPKRIEAAKEAA